MFIYGSYCPLCTLKIRIKRKLSPLSVKDIYKYIYLFCWTNSPKTEQHYLYSACIVCIILYSRNNNNAVIIIKPQTFINEWPVKNTYAMYGIDLFEADLKSCERLCVFLLSWRL